MAPKKSTKNDTAQANTGGGAAVSGFRGGMIAETYNLAVRVQCAVRDALDYPSLTLEQALEICREMFTDYELPEEGAAEWLERLRRSDADQATAKATEQERIRQSVGRTQPS